MTITTPYYEDNTRISNSSIGWFLSKGPRYFRDMLDGKEEGLKLPQLERGTMIHEYILQPEDFWDDYEILDFETPRSKQQKEALDAYFTITQIDPFLDKKEARIKAYRTSYNNKYNDDKCSEEMESLVQLYQDYLTYLQHSQQNKKIITFADLNMLKKIKENLDNHKKAAELLSSAGVEAHNEFHINWEFPIKIKMDQQPWMAPCKSLLDRVIFDHCNHKITLIDLKTTSDVYNFKHSVESFDYYRQITYYIMAITWYMKDQGIDISEYDLEAYIIAIQTNGNYEIRVFNMFNEQEIMSRKDLIIRILSELSYHYQSGNWDHTREYYETDGTEEL